MKFDERIRGVLEAGAVVTLVTDSGVFLGTIQEQGEDFIVLQGKQSFRSWLRRKPQEQIILNGSLSAICAVAVTARKGRR